MHLAVYLPLLAPLVAVLSAGRLARRLDPRLATWLLTCSAVALAAATATVLTLLVVAGLIQVPIIAHLAELSLQVIQHDDAPSMSVALLSAIALSAAVAAALRMTWRRARALLAVAGQARYLPGTGELVIIDDKVAEAFTVPGRPGRIVVSTGMLAALRQSEREVLLAHERAHLRGYHHWFTAAVQLSAAANPLLRPLARAVAFTIERWADEDAARATGDRNLVARTIAKAALAQATSTRMATSATGRRAGFALGVTGYSGDLVDLSGAGPVPRRVAALLTAPPQRGLILVIGVTVVLAATGLCTLEALRDLHDLLETASV